MSGRYVHALHQMKHHRVEFLHGHRVHMRRRLPVRHSPTPTGAHLNLPGCSSVGVPVPRTVAVSDRRQCVP